MAARLSGPQPSAPEEEEKEGQLVAAEAVPKAALGLADPTTTADKAAALLDKDRAVALPTEEDEAAANPAVHSARGEAATIPATLKTKEAPVAPVPTCCSPRSHWATSAMGMTRPRTGHGADTVADAAATGGPSHPSLQGPAWGATEPQGPNPGPALGSAISPEATPHPTTASLIRKSRQWRGRRQQ